MPEAGVGRNDRKGVLPTVRHHRPLQSRHEVGQRAVKGPDERPRILAAFPESQDDRSCSSRYWWWQRSGGVLEEELGSRLVPDAAGPAVPRAADQPLELASVDPSAAVARPAAVIALEV